jgi:ankyrin repeat protein
MGKTEENTNDVEEESLSYEDLLEIANSMSFEEACSELHYCCRWGEGKAVKALLEVFGSSSDFVNCREDENDNTPLHLAAANGYVDLVEMLVGRGASVHHTNKSGNTPLHWAAANGQERCVQLLLSSCHDGVDVLQKNNFGRSALTEGFTSQNTNVIQLLLEHESASEDRLIPGEGVTTTNTNNTTNPEHNQPCKDKNQQLQGGGVLHKFQFLPSVTLKTNNDEEIEKSKTDDDDNVLFIRELVGIPPL